MAKKKKQIKEQDKLFKVFPTIYTELDWPIGWENEDPKQLSGHIVDFIYQKVFTENDTIPVPVEIILHQTLNSFKGDSDNLKAFLFLDTALPGGMTIDKEDQNYPIPSIKGYLTVIKGYGYSFANTISGKRRVLELIF